MKNKNFLKNKNKVFIYYFNKFQIEIKTKIVEKMIINKEILHLH